MDTVIFERISKILIRLNRGDSLGDIRNSTSIVEDLGFDSLRLIDLTLAIEGEFGIRTFPIQAWYDTEALVSGKRFTVGSLVNACGKCLATGRDSRGTGVGRTKNRS